jgi:hypothetical protein
MITIIICNISGEAGARQATRRGAGGDFRSCPLRVSGRQKPCESGAYSLRISVSPTCAAAISSAQNGKRTQRLAEYSRVWSP